MINIFQTSYENRLKCWWELRQKLQNADTQTKCVQIDQFWQQCPIVNHHLHSDSISEWPTPWELLLDNTYCVYARALGMIYTLLLLGVTDIDFVDAVDYNGVEVVLVTVDGVKYILNYWPGTVVNNCLQDFTIKKRHDIHPIITKIGKI